MTNTTIGIDLAKNVFQVHGVNASGQVFVRKKLKRSELMKFITNLPTQSLIGIEACGSAHYWARRFREHKHTVKLIPPQYVKPFVKSNKNDQNDAEAICEAVGRPNMRFVPEKSIEQQDIQAAHRIRSRLVASRTALVNEARGLLSEYGVVIPLGVVQFRKGFAQLICRDNENGLTLFLKQLMAELYTEFCDLELRIKNCEKQIQCVFKASEVAQRLEGIPGIGVLAATALMAAVGDAKVFKNGRQMAAWLGLVPRQHSSGAKTRLLGISKRGDVYIRMLLIHGARNVVRYARDKTDKRSEWIKSKEITIGKNKTAVAVANKNARLVWKLMYSGESYKMAA
jgi:transposase